MQDSVQLDTNASEEAASFTLKVCATLLNMAYAHGVAPDDVVEFFATQARAMLLVPPNYKMFGQSAPVWIMRGFYPGTALFFKLTVCRNDKGTWIKASIPMMKMGRKRIYDRMVKFSSTELDKMITDKMENTFFGASHEIKPLVPKEISRMPRCMSPKGIRVFNLEKPKGKV